MKPTWSEPAQAEPFAGRTALITGGTRGIGKALAIALACRGANVTIAAKTEKPDPRLPGTLASALAEIEAACGRRSALAMRTDVRDEEGVIRAIEATVSRFGGLDMVVHNAGAIHLAPTTETPLKRFDLLMSVNLRAFYALIYHALIPLTKGTNPHILAFAPPLPAEPALLAPHVAYSISKFGISIGVLGFAEELRSRSIAVNGLWPCTFIDTTAIRNLLGGAPAASRSRSPEIVVDAALALLAAPSREMSGGLWTDEQVLQRFGVSDFTQYSTCPVTNLLPDLFLTRKGTTGR